MRRALLPLVLAAAITLTPARAQASSNVGDLFEGFVSFLFFAAAAVVVTAATVEVVTGVATYKNYRSWHRERDPSAGWVGLGGVGGLVNIGLGSYLFVDGLTPPSDPPRKGVKTGQLIFGTLMTGFGAFSLTMAIQAARTSTPQATGTNAAPLLAPVGFMLPPIRF